MVRVQEAMALILSTHQESFLSLQPWASALTVGYSFLIELFVSNIDDVVIMLIMIMKKRRRIRMMTMVMMIRISRGNPVKSRNRQLLSMQHRQNNNKDILCNLQWTLHKFLKLMMFIYFVIMIRWIKTRIFMQPPIITAQTFAGGDV